MRQVQGRWRGAEAFIRGKIDRERGALGMDKGKTMGRQGKKMVEGRQGKWFNFDRDRVVVVCGSALCK